MTLSVCVMSSDYSVFNREQAEDESDNASVDDGDQRLLTFSDSKSDVVSGHALWRQQFSAVAWLHMLNMRRERKAFVYTWVLRDTIMWRRGAVSGQWFELWNMTVYRNELFLQMLFIYQHVNICCAALNCQTSYYCNSHFYCSYVVRKSMELI